MVWVLAAGLALLALGMGLKVALLRHGMKALRRDLVERRGQDTNTLLSLPCRDRELRRLASALNDELRALRQERLRYQQGDKELKEAVVNISHDLRTPLTAISGYLQLLQGPGPAPGHPAVSGADWRQGPGHETADRGAVPVLGGSVGGDAGPGPVDLRRAGRGGAALLLRGAGRPGHRAPGAPAGGKGGAPAGPGGSLPGAGEHPHQRPKV